MSRSQPASSRAFGDDAVAAPAAIKAASARRYRRAAVRSDTAVTALLLAGLVFPPLGAQAAERKSPAFGPRLIHYPLQCHESSGCHINCYQNGVSIATRTDVSRQDQVTLVVSAGISDDVEPRWLEVRTGEAARAQVILLTGDTACDLQSFTINPLEPGR